MSSIFVFGLLQDSPGKTVVSTALARGLVNEGVNIGVFKPRSGHSLWYQYEAFLKCKSEGRLFCEDIIKLKEASKCSLPYEVLNPVDALMSPLNADTFLKRHSISRMYMLDPNVFSHLLVERYTISKEERTENILCLNEVNVGSGSVLLDNDYLIKLTNNADRIIPVRSLDEWASTFERFGLQSMHSCYKVIRKSHKNVLVEGFNDAVCPLPNLTYDIVIGVAPGVAVFYDSKEFNEVIETMTKLGKNPAALRAEDIAKFIREDKVLPVHPLPHEDLTDYNKLSKKLQNLISRVVQYIKST